MKAIKILTIFGTRPELIKLAPVIKALALDPASFLSLTCTTAQHREMVDELLETFDVSVDFDLNIMKHDQSLSSLTAVLIERLDRLFSEVQPDWILVQGDTTTVMAASLVAFYRRIKIGHVEAGLRTYQRLTPFPEEINRRITDLLSDLYFAPTEASRQNLLNEGVPEGLIHVTGNTVVDAIEMMRQPLRQLSRQWELFGRRVILVTTHRRENHGEPLDSICRALLHIAQRYEGDVQIIFPVHPNPKVKDRVHSWLQNSPNIQLMPPLDYQNLLSLMASSYLIVTDSGGIQEEAPSFSIPTLVLRESTERPEGILAGVVKLIGHNEDTIVSEVSRLLDNPEVYQAMCQTTNPYGDGQAAGRIVNAIKQIG